MESRPPSIPHPPFPRPSLFSAAPQHSRQYGSSQQPPSRPEARSQTTYDSLNRPADEPSRVMPTYNYAAHSYNPDLRSQTRSTSPTRFGAMQSDPAKRSALASPVKNNGILGKDSAFYRDALNTPYPLLFRLDTSPTSCCFAYTNLSLYKALFLETATYTETISRAIVLDSGVVFWQICVTRTV
ncbi:hypothetical protein TSTA_049090 [Talaromyces stipitatus ATCC 10500]|uniref:Uncharacterized protein n=1 Tax=Talaromyces stipitatus (strain ATCC 10500 / CBS 375.48 / QM 6759 / NRRL 1006) TaxID=441959 RepID=B8ML53_TALSN|nr:uncharacterized protein TSTA_049090 [Talaromyces stipitatus ATCC 10500]EED15469.1 hypothetical protein TSTA_049090 [Talaromyces stipitatus ATCC 10500]